MRPTQDSPMAQTGPGRSDRRLPLEGIRVVEQGAFITGPYASMHLNIMCSNLVQ